MNILLKYLSCGLLSLAPFATAAASECSNVIFLRENVRDDFIRLRGPVKRDKFQSSFRWEGAHSCTIQSNAPGDAELECEWYVAKEAAPTRAIRMFKASIDAIKRCAINPGSLEIKKNGDGEEARFDEGDGRYLWVGYDYYHHWWTLSIKYGRFKL